MSVSRISESCGKVRILITTIYKTSWNFDKIFYLLPAAMRYRSFEHILGHGHSLEHSMRINQLFAPAFDTLRGINEVISYQYIHILKDMKHANKVEFHPYRKVFLPFQFGAEIATMLSNEFLPNPEHEPKRINIVVIDFKAMRIELV